MPRLFSGSVKGLCMIRYAVQCRLRRQQYKDSLEMQVETVAETSFMKGFHAWLKKKWFGEPDYLFHEKQYMLLLLLGI